MPSTYSTSLKLELIANGEQSGTWGQTTNNNLGTLIEQAITGVGQLVLTGGDYTLTNYNGLPDESRNAVLIFGGSLASPANVIAPAVEKTYILTNNAGANITVKTSSGNGVTVQNGRSALVYCDGTDFYTAVNVNNVIGDLTVSGNETIGGNLSIGGNITLANAVSAGNLAMTANSGVVTLVSNTGAFIPPTGTSAQRPASPVVGMSRWNTDAGVYEIWNGTTWQIVASGSYNVNALVVAGGGGGNGGGGGAGGLISVSSYLVNPTTSYVVTVGAGGTGTYSSSVNGANGSNSSALGYTALGGGGGGNVGANNNGSPGGSGGGAGQTVYQVLGSGGSGTPGQGYAGGANNGTVVPNAGSGGGGGAGAVGSNGTSGAGGNGGIGVTSSITGSTLYYAGGGGGGGGTSPSSGGAGGGGNGGGYQNGTANTGGGGGTFYGSGGSGIVVISYANPTQRASGGTVTNYTSGGTVYWVHTFTTSGVFTA